MVTQLTPEQQAKVAAWKGTSTGARVATARAAEPIVQASVPTESLPPIGGSENIGVQRDTAKEAQTIQNMGFVPTNDADTLQMYIATYGDALPPEGQALQDKLASLSGTNDLANQGALGQLGQDITAYGQNASDYQAAVQTDAASIPGSLSTLQTALRMKSGVGNASLGESDIFKQAGVGGYGALSASLSSHLNEMNAKYDSFANVIQQTGQSMYAQNSADLAKAQNALEKYAMLREDYKYEQGRLDTIAQKKQALDDELTLYESKLKLDKKYSDAVSLSTSLGLGTGLDTAQAGEIFTIDGQSKYHVGQVGWEAGTNTWECGEAFNKITDGTKVGSDYATKMSAVTNRDTPQVGNGLVLPLTAKGQGLTNGHIEAVTTVTPSGEIQTVSWNRNGDGKQTIQTYTIEELNKLYGENWGFTGSKFKSEYEEKLSTAVSSQSSPVDYLKANALVQDFGNTVGERSAAASAILAYSSSYGVSLGEAKIALGYLSNSDKDLAKNAKEEVTGSIQNYNEISLKTSTIDQLLNVDLEGVGGLTAIGDVASIVNFLKVIDPRSVARESEVQSVENATSLIGRMEQAYGKWSTGQKLTTEQRADMVQAASILRTSAADYLLGQLYSRQTELQDAGIPFTKAFSQSQISELERVVGEDRAAEIKAESTGQEAPVDPDLEEYNSYSTANDPDYQEAKSQYETGSSGYQADWMRNIYPYTK